MSTKLNRAAEILIVDDNEVDRLLLQRAFAQIGVDANLSFAVDGDEALEFLRKEGEFSSAATPDLLLLDLNMPNRDGHETMQEIAESDDLKGLPVIILTTSTSVDDIQSLYRLRCNAYVAKPIQLEKLILVLQRIVDFWLETAELPSAS